MFQSPMGIVSAAKFAFRSREGESLAVSIPDGDSFRREVNSRVQLRCIRTVSIPDGDSFRREESVATSARDRFRGFNPRWG